MDPAQTMMKRSKFGQNDANEIGKRYFKIFLRINIYEAEQGRVSKIVALASQAGAYNTHNAHM